MSAEMVSWAIKVAAECHAGQLDKSGAPYVFHPIRVMLRAEGNYKVQQVAILHDVIEDTSLTLEDLRKLGFSQEVVEGVDAMTRRIKIPGGHKEDYLTEFIPRVMKNMIASFVKFLDIEDNTMPERMIKLDPEEREFLKKRYGNAKRELMGAARDAQEEFYGKDGPIFKIS